MSARMIGRYKHVNDEKGFGFITGEDGEDYFAHISEVKSVQLPYRGAIAEFTPTQNAKGFAAKDVQVRTALNRPQFVQFGEHRIKLSDIRSYRVETLERSRKVSVPTKNLWGAMIYCDKIEEYTVYRLYVYLYSNKNAEYWFDWEDEEQMKAAVKQLDEYMGNAELK